MEGAHPIFVLPKAPTISQKRNAASNSREANADEMEYLSTTGGPIREHGSGME